MLHGLGMPKLEAQALLVLPIAAVSFLGQRAFVFGPAPGQAVRVQTDMRHEAP